ncbi:MAG: sulfotransferase [Cyclobacteriaceae bacterium]|nr:sulfotransferase [Cyclobacteriaceae bacterium]
MFKIWIKTYKAVYTKRFKMNFSPSRHNSSQKFIILCHPRTGSTWLHTLLNSHPNISSIGEMNKENKTYSDIKKNGLNYLTKNLPKSIKAVGFKIFFEYLSDQNNSWLLQEITLDKNIKIIHLSRNNLLRMYVSLAIANYTGNFSTVYHNTKHNFKNKIEIDPENCITYLNKIMEFEKELLLRIKNHELLNLSYEDLESDTHNKINTILNFLQVKQYNCYSLLKKQNNDDLDKIIANFDVLEKYLKGTKLFKFLKD